MTNLTGPFSKPGFYLALGFLPTGVLAVFLLLLTLGNLYPSWGEALSPVMVIFFIASLISFFCTPLFIIYNLILIFYFSEISHRAIAALALILNLVSVALEFMSAQVLGQM